MISEKYNVSVDWILGIKDYKDVNALDLTTLTYEQVFSLINALYDSRTFEIVDRGTKEKPYLDPDYLKVKDPALSFMLRRRLALIRVDESYFQDWIEKHLPQYNGLPILLCTKEMLDYFQDPSISSFKEGDWVTKIKEYQQRIKAQNDKEGDR